MSSALVRQALEFVDQEETAGKRNRKRAGANRTTTVGQEQPHPYKQRQQKSKKPKVAQSVSSEQPVEENIKKLLALSKSMVDTAIAEKLVERAVKGKPLLEKIEVKKEEYKSILFPDEEPYSKFEKEYFCS